MPRKQPDAGGSSFAGPGRADSGRRDSVFAAATAELEAGIAAHRHVRPEFSFDSEPPPRRLAPQAVAFAATVQADGTEVGWGRFVLLYDPAGQEGWEGPFRIIAYLRAELEPDIAADPLIGQVGWSWLTEALDARAARYAAPSGTVTRVVSEGFGAKQGEPVATGFEMRASWSPTSQADAEGTGWPDAPRPGTPKSRASRSRAGQPGATGQPSETSQLGSATGQLGSAGQLGAVGQLNAVGRPGAERFCLDRHVAAWADALSTAAGLPPLAPGVAQLRPARPVRPARPPHPAHPRHLP